MTLKLVTLWTKSLFLALCLGLLSALLLAGLTTLGVQAAPPAPGSLDTGFGVGGVVTTTIGSGNASAQAVVIQSDGKIVVAGYSDNDSDSDFSLARYNTDGSLDTTFGSSGVVTTPLGSSYDQGFAVALQSDGKMVVAGGSYNGSNWDFALARYTITGSLDTTFGSGGVVTTPLGSGNDVGQEVALQSDGKIVVAGYSYNSSSGDYDFALARYTITGSLDTTFGSGGVVTTPIGSSFDWGRAVALQNDGKIVVVGESANGGWDFALARYTITGSLDTTFGSGGIVTTPIGSGDDWGRAVALQNDGKIVVAGYSHGSIYDFALIRYNSNGTLDTDFGSGGIVTTPIGSGDDQGWTVALQSDDKIVVAGRSHNGSNFDFALARYNTDGSLDTGFGSSGVVTTPLGGSDDVGYGVAVQSDGQIVVAGSSDNGSDDDFALARYNGEYQVYLPLVVQPLDTTQWYRLINEYQGLPRSLDVGSGGSVFMGITGDEISSQSWQFTDLGNGYYRLNNQFLGAGKSLDIDPVTQDLVMNNTANVTGQHWKLTDLGGGYYRLTNQFLGAGKSLDIVGSITTTDSPVMNDSSDASGQHWQLIVFR